MRPTENSEKSLDFTYHNKDAYTETSLYNIVFNALNNPDKFYNSMISRTHDPVTEGNYKLIGETRFIPILEHKYDKIQWA